MLDDIPDQRSKDQDRQGRQQNTEHRAADIEPDLAQVICIHRDSFGLRNEDLQRARERGRRPGSH